MTFPRILIIVALVLAGVMAWQFRDRLPLPAGVGALPATSPATESPGTLRKCVQGDRVLYTDGACPPGSRALDVREDRVTVVPATRVPAAAAPVASGPGLPNARDVLGRPDDGQLRDKRMQQQIGD
jgi:hypothetical protein